MQTMHPTPDLSRIDADPSREPRLPSAVLFQDALQRGVDPCKAWHDPNCTYPTRTLSSRLDTSKVQAVPNKCSNAVLPFPERLRQLAKAAGYSVEWVLHEAWDTSVAGTSPNTVKKAARGERPLRPVQMEAIADVLGVSPNAFVEYRLARARRLLDETQVSLEEAADHLNAIERGTPLTALLDELTEGRQLGSAGGDLEVQPGSAGGNPSGPVKRPHDG
jgi:transcriptional regulator with XRE-family HTH domain